MKNDFYLFLFLSFSSFILFFSSLSSVVHSVTNSKSVIIAFAMRLLVIDTKTITFRK